MRVNEDAGSLNKELLSTGVNRAAVSADFWGSLACVQKSTPSSARHVTSHRDAVDASGLLGNSGGARRVLLPSPVHFVFHPSRSLSTTTTATRCESFPTNSRCLSARPLLFPASRRLSAGIYVKKGRRKEKREKKEATATTKTKSPLHSLSRRQKERLIFSARFQIMKGRTSAGRCASLSWSSFPLARLYLPTDM